MGEGEDRRSIFHSIKLGLSGKKDEIDNSSRKAGSMILPSPTSISYPFDVVHKKNVAPPGAPPDLYTNRPVPATGSMMERGSASPKNVIRPVSLAASTPPPPSASTRSTSPSARAISPRRQSPSRSRDRAISPRRSSPSRTVSPRRTASPTRATSPRRSPYRSTSPRQRPISPRHRSPSRAKSPSRNDRSPRRRSPRRVSPSRVRSPRDREVETKARDRERELHERRERAVSPRRRSPVRTFTRPSQSSRNVALTRPPAAASPPASPPTSTRPRTGGERRADREREREHRERERDARERRRPPRSVADLNIGPRTRREHVQRSQRKAPREDARAVVRHLSEKATVRSADVRRRAADTGDLPFFGVTRVRPVNTTRTPRQPRLVLQDDEEEREAKWTRSDVRALLRSGAKFDAWVEARHLRPLLEARRHLNRAMTSLTDSPPQLDPPMEEVTKEDLLSNYHVPAPAEPKQAKPGKKKRFKSLPASYWMRFIGRAMPSNTPPSDSPQQQLSPSPSSTSSAVTRLPVTEVDDGSVTAMQFLEQTSPRGKTPAAVSPKAMDVDRLRGLLAGKGTVPVRDDGLFVSSPSLVSSTMATATTNAASRRSCLQTALAELLTPRPPEEQANVKERIDNFLFAYRAYCSAADLLRLLDDAWHDCAEDKLPEPDRVRQNVLYMVWRWINISYSCDFLKENGLPDPAPYKALSALMLCMSDTHQQGLSKKIAELSESPFPRDILDRPIPVRLSWIDNRANQILRPDFSLMTLPVKDIARAFLMHDMNLFGKLRRVEMVARAYPRLATEFTGGGVLPQITIKWNATQTWVSNELVSTPKLKERAILLEKFILLAEELFSESRNFHTFYAVMFGLKDPTVTRLKSTWQRLPAEAFTLFKEMDKETDFGRGYRSYRASIAKAKEDRADVPVVPFIVAPLSDLVALAAQHDMIDATGAEGNLFNSSKAASVARIINEFETQQRELTKWLDNMAWDENDIAVLRQLPVSHLERYKGITQDTLLELSKWVEPASLA